jgi:hypothetical protein
MSGIFSEVWLVRTSVRGLGIVNVGGTAELRPAAQECLATTPTAYLVGLTI